MTQISTDQSVFLRQASWLNYQYWYLEILEAIMIVFVLFRHDHLNQVECNETDNI